MMKAGSIFETFFSLYETAWRIIPEDSLLHTRSREKIKSHRFEVLYRAPLYDASVVIECGQRRN
jgi:hypothetical protein